MSKRKIIIGAGRHAAETFYFLEDLGLGNDVIAFAVDAPNPGQKFLGKDVISIPDLLKENTYSESKPQVLVAIGNVSVNKRLVQSLQDASYSFFSAINEQVNPERQQYLGTGITIATGTILTCNISIGDNTIINIGCTISHDCIIGKHVNISPGCHLAGGVIIEDGVFVGIGASFIPGVKVGAGSVVAAGACVTRDVPPDTMVAGVPASVKKALK